MNSYRGSQELPGDPELPPGVTARDLERYLDDPYYPDIEQRKWDEADRRRDEEAYERMPKKPTQPNNSTTKQ